MPNVTITFNDRDVRKRLTMVGAGLKSYKKPFTEIGEDLMGYFGKQVFDSQGKELGAPWRPLAPATLKARAERRGYYANTPVETNKILVWTGRMRAAFRRKAEAFRLTIDNTDEKFAWNQPTRPMLAINRKVIETVVTRIEGYIRSLIKK